jgi:hypothetical protein
MLDEVSLVNKAASTCVMDLLIVNHWKTLVAVAGEMDTLIAVKMHEDIVYELCRKVSIATLHISSKFVDISYQSILQL